MLQQLSSSTDTALLVIGGAGVACVIVKCAIWSVWQIRYLLIERQEANDYYDRYK